ncbi:MAG: SH3 domain-containing protein [Aureispira sp.]|nr:SH3 domain-containing protein [Aureispira sp.]
MKMNLLFLIFFSTLISCSNEQNSSEEILYTTFENVELKTKAGENAHKVSNLQKGEAVKFFGKKTSIQGNKEIEGKSYRDFYLEVKTKSGVTGWVHAALLQFDKPSLEIKEPTKNIDIVKKEKAKIDNEHFAQFSGNYADVDEHFSFGAKIYYLDEKVLKFDIRKDHISGCVNQLEGNATFENKNTAIYKTSDCSIIFFFDGKKLKITENGTCKLNAKACSFTGIITKDFVYNTN